MHARVSVRPALVRALELGISSTVAFTQRVVKARPKSKHFNREAGAEVARARPQREFRKLRRANRLTGAHAHSYYEFVHFLA